MAEGDLIPSDYDLRKLLTEQFVNDKPWSDMAQAMSLVLYEKVEQQRIALSLAREPAEIVRLYKVLSVKMLGLDYKSDILTDDDYDRLLKFIGIYSPEKGTMDFIKFMGFVKNMKLDIIPLWTTDYKDFRVGIPFGEKKVYDTPKGPWYPTTHVGLVYDELITKSIDEAELERFFYKMAPINLVLKWIAAVITIRLPTLYIAVNFLDEEEIMLNVFVQYIAMLYYAVQFLDEEEWVACNAPYEPILAQQLKGSIAAVAQFGESSYSYFVAGPQCYWNKDVTTQMPIEWDYKRDSVAGVWHKNTVLEYLPPNIPRTADYDSDNNLLGWLFEPARTNFLAHSLNFSQSIWSKTNITVTEFNVSPDRVSKTYKIMKNTSGFAFMTQVKQIQTRGKHVGSMLVKQGSSRYAALVVRFLGTSGTIEAGVVVDLANGDTVPINPDKLVAYGAESKGSAWRPWVTIDGLLNATVDMKLYPAYATSLSATHNPAATGWVEAWAGQLELGSRPTSIISTLGNPATRQYSNLNIPPALSQLNKTGFAVVHYASNFANLDEPQTLLDAYQSPTEYHLLQIVGGRTVLKMGSNGFTNTIVSPNILNSYVTNKLAYAWNTENSKLRLFENGTKIYENFLPPPQNLQVCRFGSRYSGEEGMYGHLEQLLIADIDPTDQLLSDLTLI